MTEHAEITNLSMFLLDCPVQAATCERLFKEFACLHTKLRNRLSSKTSVTEVMYSVPVSPFVLSLVVSSVLDIDNPILLTCRTSLYK
jgi:hypothetical protein